MRPSSRPLAASTCASRVSPSGWLASWQAWREARAASADYCYGMSKFGGNAQAITKNRWLHHTSFLWDFDATSMQLLQMPAKAPAYRAVRLIGRAAHGAASTADKARLGRRGVTTLSSSAS